MQSIFQTYVIDFQKLIIKWHFSFALKTSKSQVSGRIPMTVVIGSCTNGRYEVYGAEQKYLKEKGCLTD